MPVENASVRAERARQQAAFDEGMGDGYNHAAAPLPAWYFTKTLEKLTARERGFWYGRETRMQESVWGLTEEGRAGG